MTACTHSTVIEDARNSQPKRINAKSPILSQRHTAESRIDVYYGPTDVGVKMGFKPRVTLGTLLNQLILE